MNAPIHSETPTNLKLLIAQVVICFGLSVLDALAQKVDLDDRHNMPLQQALTKRQREAPNSNSIDASMHRSHRRV